MASSDALQTIGEGLTSEQMADIVKNASQNNFFMYAFIIFAFIMIVGMVSMVWIFIRKDTKKDQRQNEQYKDLLNSQSIQYKSLLDGYTKMIDQNAKTNSEFSETIADIGKVLRELSNTIIKSETKSDGELDKFGIMLQRFDSLKVEISKSNDALHQSFRDHEKNCIESHATIDKSLQAVSLDLKRNTEWCQNINKKQ